MTDIRRIYRRTLLKTMAEWCFHDGQVDWTWYYMLMAHCPDTVEVIIETKIQVPDTGHMIDFESAA